MTGPEIETEMSNHDRAAEIIAAYGGDPARWPDAERAAALAVVAADPVLAMAQRAANELDRDLAAWARTPVTVSDAAARAAAAIRPVRAIGRWFAGGGIAAAAVAAAVVLSLPGTTPVAIVAPTTVSDVQAFTAVFTPTPDEENLT